MKFGEEVISPLDGYAKEFREAFQQQAEATFDELVAASQVDAAANEATVAKWRALCAEAASAGSKKGWTLLWIWLLLLLFLGIGGYLGYRFIPLREGGAEATPPLLGALGGLLAYLVPLLKWLVPRYKRLKKLQQEKEAEAAEEQKKAWEQMEPLNSLYEWDIPARLISAVIPDFQFDRFCTAARMAELQSHFDYGTDPKEDTQSVTAVISGHFRGNPFAVVRTLNQDWGTKTYYGYKTIHWTERVRGSDGKTRTVQRSETLTATVTKPIPVYAEESRLIYGNEAAPNLTFTRQSEGLAEASQGFLGRMRLRHAAKKLHAFSQNLEDASQYTMMSNEEFETLFNTRDRNDEKEFRLLYTPWAQREILRLIKDKEVGYGDDFSIVKWHRCNVVQPAHLREVQLNADPDIYRNFDLKDARQKFIGYCCTYFRAFFFAMAPLLAVPLYQEKRGLYDMSRDEVGIPPEAAAWEDEALANYYGEDRFKAQESITHNILTTKVLHRKDGVAQVQVVANGFRGVTRVDHQSVRGGDGRLHDVAVEWIEYLPVSAAGSYNKSEQSRWDQAHYASPAEQRAQEWRDFFQKLGGTPQQARMRRDIISFFM